MKLLNGFAALMCVVALVGCDSEGRKYKYYMDNCMIIASDSGFDETQANTLCTCFADSASALDYEPEQEEMEAIAGACLGRLLGPRE